MLTEDSITWIAERQLTENTELEVPNMASISKDVLYSHVSSVNALSSLWNCL